MLREFLYAPFPGTVVGMGFIFIFIFLHFFCRLLLVLVNATALSEFQFPGGVWVAVLNMFFYFFWSISCCVASWLRHCSTFELR